MRTTFTNALGSTTSDRVAIGKSVAPILNRAMHEGCPTNELSWRRRDILQGAAAAGLAVASTSLCAAEPPPETTRIRLGKFRSICLAPQYVAEDLLRAEGFTDIAYVETATGTLDGQMISSGQIEIGMDFAAKIVDQLDKGASFVVLAGIHAGCFELFGTNGIKTIGDLKGRTTAVPGLGSSPHLFLSSIAASVGVDPQRDIRWLTHPPAEAKQMLAAGKIDAFLGFPPDPQELRAMKVGQVVLNSAIDRPWAQYFCCLVRANREFAHRNPIATKRALRAIIKGSEMCAVDPEIGAQAYLKQGYSTNPEYARQALREIPYGRWRDYNPEETIRFYALRLREAGMVKNTPQKLISQGTDWRLLEQLKREMKT
jgi:NitT/TauT family transport system substrate-binding protein